MDRQCYCEPEQNYCGVCGICNNPGHISHHPGGIPYTGSWCDLCYERLRVAFLNPLIPSE